MKRMLINATQEEELRMAMVDGQRLYDLNIELPASERKKANIYKGQITRIEPSLEAAFVNYGSERHGFLPLKEISPEYFVKDPGSGKPSIKDVLREGQDIVIQIDKEERGNKGAALTTYVSLAGRFIVLKPNKSRSGGVSRRIVGEERDLARKSLRDVDVPNDMSVILRTAGIERTAEELTWDMENLLAVWEAIKKVVVERESPFLIYRESNAVVRALRDYLTNEIGEILIDDEATYQEAQEFVEQVMPHNLRKLKHYTDSVPLFTRYQIDSQIESAFAHSVNLPSGGSLVIDHTEALVSIDINSARATKGGDIEATALNTNLEAADEVARQLRLRDLGGLVVIDFIDMGPQRNQREVENRLRDAVRQDRARVQLSKISRFGLLEMSRQRLRPSLGESSYLVCPRCSGIGNIRSVESLALAILRIIGEEARKERTAKVIAQLPIEVATYLLNEKRDWVQSLESRHDTQVILVANPALETPHFQVRRVRDDQVDLPENVGNSFMLVESEDEPEITQAMQDKKAAEVAAVTTVVATTPAPPRQEPVASTKSAPGLLARLAGFFGGSAEEAEEPQKKTRAKTRSKSSSDSRRRGGQRNKKRSDSQRQGGNKGQQRQKQSTAKKRSKKATGKAAERKAESGTAKQGKTTRGSGRGDEGQDKQAETRQTASKRRSRGGRRRRRGQDATDSSESQSANQQNESQSAKQTSSSNGAEAKTKPARRPRRAKSEPAAKDSSATESAAKSVKEAPPKQEKRAPRKKVATTDKPESKTADRPDRKKAAPKLEVVKSEPTPALTQVETKAPRAEKSAADNVKSKSSAKPSPLTQVQTKKTAKAKPESPSLVQTKKSDSVVSDSPTRIDTAKSGGGKPESPGAAPARKPDAGKPTPAGGSGKTKSATVKSVPAPAKKKPERPAGYEDTQPELTIIKPPKQEKPKVAAAPGNGESKPASKSESTAAAEKNKPKQQDKPAARLLPWEPDSPSPKDKD
ncbi:MAG: Rne/Rng family ribonuclease [Woeseiaceae bacterium]